MKILINRKPVEGPWGGGNLFVSSFCEYFSKKGCHVVHQLEPGLDVIFMQDPRYSDLGISINEISNYKNANPKTRVFHRVNECDARKGTNDIDSLLRACSALTDHTIFVSKWMREYHLSKGWKCENSSVIYNGVNLDHFKKRKKIENNKTNIVTHHWSDNPYKGSDVYQFLDKWVATQENFTFTYIGRTSDSLPNSTIIKPLHGKNLGEELSKYDIYVSGSRFDPGPNHIIESLACQIPTLVHKDGGGAVEFSGKDSSFETAQDLIRLINKIATGDQIQNSMKPKSWSDCMEKVYNVIQDSLKNE